MNTHLTHSLAQSRSAELHRAAERSRAGLSDRRIRARIHLRALAREDRDGLAALFARLSPTSRYLRFFTPKRMLSDRELAYLSNIDHVDHEAIAAVDDQDGSLVGVGRYVRRSGDSETAEVSFAVIDEFQGMGVGSALAAEIVRRACANGIATLTASMLGENRAAFALARRLGFRRTGGQGAVIELALELPCPAPSPACPSEA